MIRKSGFLLLLIIFLTACSDRDGLAPVIDLNWNFPFFHATSHTVVKGDTLYSVAFRYDLDYHQLAVLNHLRSPYTLRIGQVINLRLSKQPPRKITPIPRSAPSGIRPMSTPVPTRVSNSTWSWPAYGHIVAVYSPQSGVKGINIAGKKGDKIYAALDGVVAYSGNGLGGYGNLILIRHNNQLLTAYGNNLRNVVQEGNRVKKGQVIAEMGVVDRHYWGVHFEIRRWGQPVNPLIYLKG